MKKKIVLALLTATVAGTALTGCGGKTAETAPAETVETTEEASDEEVEVSEKSAEDSIDESLEENDADNAEATDEEATAEGEEIGSVDDIDESTILDTDVPENPEDAMDIILKIKDPEIRYKYYSKVNEVYFDYSTDETTAIAVRWLDAMDGHIEFILEGIDAVKANN